MNGREMISQTSVEQMNVRTQRNRANIFDITVGASVCLLGTPSQVFANSYSSKLLVSLRYDASDGVFQPFQASLKYVHNF